MNKVIFLTDGIWPYVIGGMQKHSYYMIKYLSQLGINIIVVHTIPDKSKNIQIEDIFTKEELSFIKFYEVEWPKLAIPFLGHYIYENYQYSKQIYKEIRNHLSSCDLIYAQGFAGWYLLNQEKRSTSKKVIVNFHGMNMFQKASSLNMKLQQLIFRPFVKENLRMADHSISLGGKLTDILKKYSKRVEIIPIGIEDKWIIDTADLRKNKNQIHFIFIGRYDKLKGIVELSGILPEVKGEFLFDFIGPIPEKYKINNSNIHYYGTIHDENKIMSILRQSDVLVCPSWSEGMPTVILEAMASGCAILATDVGAVREIVSDDNGWLISPGNKNELLNTLNLIIQSKDDLLMSKKQQSLLKVKEFTWDKVINQTIKQLL